MISGKTCEQNKCGYKNIAGFFWMYTDQQLNNMINIYLKHLNNSINLQKIYMYADGNYISTFRTSLHLSTTNTAPEN